MGNSKYLDALSGDEYKALSRAFAFDYYGWDIEPPKYDIPDASEAPAWLKDFKAPDELPFN